MTRPTQNIPDVATAIRLMTLQPAKLLHHENKTGSLEVGKLADLIIVDRDILTIPTSQASSKRPEPFPARWLQRSSCSPATAAIRA